MFIISVDKSDIEIFLLSGISISISPENPTLVEAFTHAQENFLVLKSNV